MVERGKTTRKLDPARYPERVTAVFLCVLLLIFPFVFGPGGYTTITEVKYEFFKWAALIYIGAMVLLMGELSLMGKSREMLARLRRFGPVQALVLCYVLFCCVSAALSPYGGKVWLGFGRYEGLGTCLLYAGVFLLVSWWGRLKKWHLYLVGIVVLVNAGIGLLQFMQMNPFGLFPQGYTYHDAFKLYANAFMGTLGNIDLLSAYLSLVLPLFYVYYVLQEKATLLLVPFGLGVFLLILSGVSAGVVGIGVGVLISVPLLGGSKRRCQRILTAGGVAALAAAAGKSLLLSYEKLSGDGSAVAGYVPLVLLAAAVILFVAAVLLMKQGAESHWNDRLVQRLLAVCVIGALVAVPLVLWAYPFGSGTAGALHKLLHGELDPKLGSSRIAIWQNVLKLVPERLFLGGGPDTLAARLNFSFQRYNEATGTMIQSVVDTAHNDYLNILVNTGLFSLLAYLGALISAAVGTLKVAVHNKTAVVLFVALLCYLIQIFFSFSICIVSPFFWICLGLLVAALHPHSQQEAN